MMKKGQRSLTAFWQKWGGKMGKMNGLIFHNLKKGKGQYLSFGIIILLTAFILNLALVLLFQVDKAYDRKFQELNTANINFLIPKVQDRDDLADKCFSIGGVEDVESREGILTSAVIEDFRGVDFTINTIFYDYDSERRLNELELMEESNEFASAPVYVPLFVAQFGEFALGESITYQLGGESDTFQIAGIVQEMQYGNAGSGLVGAYLPEDVYTRLAACHESNQVVEYSLVTKEDADIAEISNELNALLYEKNINLLSLLDSDAGKQVRTMVCNLTILILIIFSMVILAVSMFLCKFRIQNTLEEEVANMGVLKAMGYTGNMIIGTTVFPYMIVGIITALWGILLSYLLLPVLAQVLALQSGFSFSLHFDFMALGMTLGTLVGITLLFTYFAARRIKRLQPINAIRGNTGTGSSEKSQYVLLFLVSFLVMVLVSFAGTLFYNVVIKPDNFTGTLAEETPEIILKIKADCVEELKSSLKEDAQVEKVLEYATETVKGKSGSMIAFVCEDFSLVSNDLCYEGRNPEKGNEVAIGSAYEKEYSIGDKIEIQCDNASYTYEIVGFIQSVNYQGEVCELTREGYLHINEEYSGQSLYLYLCSDVDVEKYLSDLERENTGKIISSVNYDKMTKVTQDMYAGIVKIIIAAIFIITLLIVLLILYIIIKSLIVRRKQEFGIYKALGYSNMQLMMKIAGSFFPVSVTAILSSAVLGLWYMPVIDQVIFKMVGAMKNHFQISLAVLFLFAFVQMVINFVISVGLSLPIKKISAYSLIKEC